MYNDICISFPKCIKISDSRKKAIKARLKKYNIDDFRTMFKIAESSDFLKGSNNKNWSATLDWMLKDTNFIKILEGNYANRGGGNNGPTINTGKNTDGIVSRAIAAGANETEWEGFGDLPGM